MHKLKEPEDLKRLKDSRIGRRNNRDI